MRKFKFGFSLVEVTTVLLVLGVIMVLATATTVKLDNIKEKKLDSMSKKYFANVDNAYGQILAYNAANGDVTGLQDANGDSKIDGSDLREYFNHYMDGDDIDCSKLGTESTLDATFAGYLKNCVCSVHPGEFIVGYYLDTNCNTSVKAKETYTKDEITKVVNTATRDVTKACGYIVYGPRKSTGFIGKDAFVVPIGRIGLK